MANHYWQPLKQIQHLPDARNGLNHLKMWCNTLDCQHLEVECPTTEITYEYIFLCVES